MNETLNALMRALGLSGARRAAPSAAFADHYCDIAGFDPEREVIYAHDSSDCTLLEIGGVRSIVSDGEFEDHLQDGFVAGVSQLLKRRGHAISVSYESSANVEDELAALTGNQLGAAAQKGLSVHTLLEEGQEILLRRARRERLLMALWTTPNAGFAEDVKRERANNLAEIRDLPPARNAQSPYLHLAALDGPHAGFVQRVEDALSDTRLIVKRLGPDGHGRRRDIAEIRRAVLFNETPSDWTPFGAYDRTYAGAKRAIDNDTSEFLAPPIAQQVLSSGALASANLRTIAMGGRRYAVVAISVFPKTIRYFNDLLSGLLGEQRGSRMPFRIAFHFEDIDNPFGLRKVLAGLASWSNPQTRNLFDSLRKLEEINNRDSEAVIKARITATTWIEPGEAAEILEQRRSFLVRALMTWGDTMVMEAPHNPMRALAETVPGMTLRAVIAPPTLAPLSHVAAMLPFHRTAPVFARGETIFTTLDGTLFAHEVFSSQQNAWLTLINATPGSGKSVLLNRLNFDFTCFAPGARLPFVCVIDVGVSSSGYIALVKNGLPEHRKHEALYVRLQNARHHAINPFDLGLGRRAPLPRESVFVENFLLSLIGLRAGSAQLLQQLVSRLVKRVYQVKSDLEIGSSPEVWQGDFDPDLATAARSLGITLNDRTRCWQLVDAFLEHGQFHLALRAQRFASPRLEHIPSLLAEGTIRDDFPPDLIQLVQRAVETAMDRYPIFTHTTALDIGDARVMSIDLQDVVQRQKSEEAEANNTLMFMAARQAFVSKISGSQEELRGMALPEGELGRKYQSYWRERYADIAQSLKRLAMDEYHLTGGTPQIQKLVLSDSREGRKWGLEVILASQLLRDFEGMRDMASTVMILNADSEQMRKEAQAVFGFSDAVKAALQRHVHGPRDGKGANILVRYTLKEEERWAIITNAMGPRLLWAMTTRMEDRLVRDEMYQRMALNEALRILAHRYPAATARDHWDRVAASNFDDTRSIPKIIVDQIMGELVSGGGLASQDHRKAAE